MKNTLTLTLALKPSPQLVKRIKAWLKKEMAPHLVLKIQVNPAILAGAIISFQGRYLDFSLKKKIEKLR